MPNYKGTNSSGNQYTSSSNGRDYVYQNSNGKILKLYKMVTKDII